MWHQILSPTFSSSAAQSLTIVPMYPMPSGPITYLKPSLISIIQLIHALQSPASSATVTGFQKLVWLSQIPLNQFLQYFFPLTPSFSRAANRKK